LCALRRKSKQEARIGQIGVAVSPLYPGSKARFGDTILDVLTQREMIECGRPVKIIGHAGGRAVVEEVM
jgi:membrane-bound ClpP family serine protease